MAKSRSSNSRRLRRGSAVALETYNGEGGIEIVPVPKKNQAAFLRDQKSRILKMGEITKGRPARRPGAREE